MKKAESRRIPLTPDDAGRLMGPGDENLREICRILGVAAVYRNGYLVYTGQRESLDRAQAATERLMASIQANGKISRSALAKALEFPELRAEGLVYNVPGRAGRIIPRTPGQES